MNTMAIPTRPIFATVSEWRVPEFIEHYAPYVWDREEKRTEPPPAVRFEHDLARFQRAVGHERDALRCAIIKRLLKEDDPDEFIQTTLRTLVSSARPGRLDDAVDILSACGRLLPHFILEMLLQPQPPEMDEDYWYALIRGVGKSTLPSALDFVEMLGSKSREAAVEALGDIGNDRSLERLRAIAAGDPSEFVRKLAVEVIGECSE